MQTVETARVGDRIAISGHRVGEAARNGEIVAVAGGDGRPHYRVRWADGHESVVYPGSDTVVERVRRARPKQTS